MREANCKGIQYQNLLFYGSPVKPGMTGERRKREEGRKYNAFPAEAGIFSGG